VSPLRGTYRGGGEASLVVSVRGETLDETRGVTIAHPTGDAWGRKRLIQYQTLGTAAQMQRLGAMTQTMGTMTQTMGTGGIGPGMGMRYQQDDEEVPRQQPQQQQQ
jgi:hypothetical protein